MGPATESVADIGSRVERLTDKGGVVIDGSTATFVYNTGIRYDIDLGGPVQVPATGDAAVMAPRGLLTLSAGSATWTGTTGGSGVVAVDSAGAGTMVDKEGVITVAEDGSLVCVGAASVQVVQAGGASTSTSSSGTLIVEADGTTSMVGKTPAGAEQVGRFAGCNVGGTASVELSGDVLFEFDKDTLAPSARTAVAAAVKLITSTAKGKPLTVIGHTDALASDAYNQALSERRAETVRTALAAALPGTTIKASGVGENQPVAPNTTVTGADNPEGRALNRRVTITWPR